MRQGAAGAIVEITVTDQGIGIAERRERVFERFYRVDPARSRATGGTGLGLAIVKHIATNHGGEVTVWSDGGTGSTFTLRLPAAAHTPETRPTRRRKRDPRPGRRGRGVPLRPAVLPAAQGGLRGRGRRHRPDALAEFDRDGADIVLLDLMLPGLSGTEVCRALRARSTVPVIMLTAKDSEMDKVVGLELGADDYVTKPYSARELVARIRAVLRRRGEPDELVPADVEAGPVRLDVDRHVVTVGGEAVTLPLKEFELLELLLRNAGRVLTRGQLIDRVWGSDYVGDTKTLDVHVKRLRAKIEPDPASPRHIVTVRGLGYKFEASWAGVGRGRSSRVGRPCRRLGSTASRARRDAGIDPMRAPRRCAA